MKIVNLKQGTPEWHAFRAEHLNASEAPAMMGVSKKISRNELIQMKATGSQQEFSEWVQKNLLDKGHEIEAKARPIAEELIGEELYPAIATDDDDYLGASFDGITMLETISWECKSWNEEKAAIVLDGRVPDEDKWQVVQQLVIGVEKCLYMVTDGTKEKTISVWVTLDEADKKKLLAGWKQFEEDVENYKPVEVIPEVVGRAPEELPSLYAEVQGKVVSSNLVEFKNQAIAVFKSINKDLKTDEDFANAEKTVKWCQGVETKLEATKQHVLGQTASIDELFRTIDEVKELARQTRLEQEKLVKARKQAIRGEILSEAKEKLAEHIEKVNQSLGGTFRLPEVSADFAGAMKNKRTIASLRDAVDTELARVKIQTNEIADKIRINADTLKSEAQGYEGLFPDTQQLVLKENEDLCNVIKLRISEHKQAEEKRLEEERERIRKEEAAKLEQKEQEQTAPAPSTDQAGTTPVQDRHQEDTTQAPGRHQAGTRPAQIQPAKSTHKPSDDQIIEVLALHYRVHESKVIEWLLQMDLNQASNKVVNQG